MRLTFGISLVVASLGQIGWLATNGSHPFARSLEIAIILQISLGSLFISTFLSLPEQKKDDET